MKNNLKNIVAPLLYQMNAMVWGLILPRLYLQEYGASIHGLSSTVSTIMNYVALLSGGIGIVAAQSLYGVLSKHQQRGANSIYRAIQKSYIRIGFYYLIAVAVIALILPVFIGDEIQKIIVILMMFIVGFQSVLNCFLVNGNTTFLQADGKYYIVNIILLFELNIRNILQVLLIRKHFSVLAVSLVPVLLVFFTALCLKAYLNRAYRYLKEPAEPDYQALSKRKSGMVHQIAGLVVNSTDVIILTVFTDQIQISIYSVYSYVVTHIHNLLNMSLSYGVIASFGHLVERGDLDALRRKYDRYEFMVFGINTVVYSLVGILIIPYVSLYANGVSDINYVDYKLALFFTVIGYLNSMRIPSLMLINARGDYRETQNQALIEAGINLVVSITLVFFIGIYGVLTGTVASFLYRTTVTVLYAQKKILRRNSRRSFARIGFSILCIAAACLLTNLLHLNYRSWGEWILNAVMIGAVFAAMLAALYWIRARAAARKKIEK